MQNNDPLFHLKELLEAATSMDALMDNLWKAVNWGQTSNLDIELLNTAPDNLKRIIRDC